MIELSRLPFWRVLIPGLMLLACAYNLDAGSGNSSDQPPRANLVTAEFLLGDGLLNKPLATSAFAPPDRSPSPAQAFEGLLTLDSDSESSHIEVLVDRFGIANEEKWRLTTLPPFSFKYVSDGEAIIPVEREPQKSSHPYWEIILQPGSVWADSTHEDWSRAALPFALKEANQNCTHNGLMTFLYKKDGSISRVAWQVTSETCLYLKIDLWGTASARYEPRHEPEFGDVVSAYRDELSSRLTVRPIGTLTDEYPDIDPEGLMPPGIENVSVYGLIIDGIHYRSECPTRSGQHPFCETLALPSYSLAKSVFGGLGYLLLTRKWPEFADQTVAGLIPECDLDDQRWQNVTTTHLANMNTGLYQSSDFERDENSPKMDDFFLPQSHQKKVRFSCEAWPKKSAAGSVAVYHTTDTYLLGVAMNNFLKDKFGQDADVYEFLHEQAFTQLGLSPLSRWTQRTYDERAQPFTGYGLIFHADDLVKIASSLNSNSTVAGLLAGDGLNAAMFRGSNHQSDFKNLYGKVAYNNGFWGFDASTAIDCPVQTWIPFMSGYGGIVVAMFPDGGVYYYFSDSGQHSFKNAAAEANKALNYCKES